MTLSPSLVKPLSPNSRGNTHCKTSQKDLIIALIFLIKMGGNQVFLA